MISLHLDALTDGRLVIGISKYDEFIESQTPEKRGHSPEVSLQKLKNNIVEDVKVATKTVISSDMVIPLSGYWALVHAKLAKQEDKASSQAREILERYPDPSLPGGEEQSWRHSRIHINDVAYCLEQRSGLALLKERYPQVCYKNSTS